MTVEISVTLPTWCIDLLDSVIETQYKQTGTRWTREEVAERFLKEDLRAWRDGAFMRKLLEGKNGNQ